MEIDNKRGTEKTREKGKRQRDKFVLWRCF